MIPRLGRIDIAKIDQLLHQTVIAGELFQFAAAGAMTAVGKTARNIRQGAGH
jgi:hypothetical protein